MEENHPNRETDFMKETIKQRPLNRRKLIRRTLVTVAMAVIFATVACLTFLLLEPVISNKLYPEEETAPVVLAEEDEILPEDMIVDESQMNPDPTPAQQYNQIIGFPVEIKLGIEDYAELYSALSDVAKEVQKSMVIVTGITSDVDWFDNIYENEGSISGVIIADNGKEILILSNYNAIASAEEIKIRFKDNSEYDATIKKRDLSTDLAILSVLKSSMEKRTLEMIQPITLGSTTGTNLTGSPVIAIGHPTGTADSLCYGFITSSSGSIDLPDLRCKWLSTDIYGSTSATGVLVNLRGKVVGIIDTAHSNSDAKNLIGALGITDLKKSIECMSNNRDIPYLGIHGSDVTQEISEEMGIPMGVYIMGIDMDSPAMNAGIQSGDIISKVGREEINTYQELFNCMVESVPEQPLLIKLLRQGPEGYTEMELEVTPRIR